MGENKVSFEIYDQTSAATPTSNRACPLAELKVGGGKGGAGRGNKLIRYFCDVTVFDGGEICFFLSCCVGGSFPLLRYYFLLV